MKFQNIQTTFIVDGCVWKSGKVDSKKHYNKFKSLTKNYFILLGHTV